VWPRRDGIWRPRTVLTPTEREVAELVAEGLSNPGIADRLFISRAIVKTHLTHVFTKLDITNRAQLTALVTPLCVRIR
jgi:DNA-binding CsgD family transcriptional regulator